MKSLRAAIAAFMLAPMLAACTLINDGDGGGQEVPDPASTEAVNAVRNELTAGITDADTFNPLYTASSTVSDMCGFVFEPLFGIDPSYRTDGVLAESYTMSPDGRMITISLKKGVYWHDGSGFTAADAVYTANLIKSGGTRYDRLMEPVMSIWAANDYTVCATFGRAVPDPVSLFIFPIIKNGSASGVFSIVGTGPFYFDATNNLTATDWYHGARASIDRIRLQMLPDNEKLISLLDASVVDFLSSEKLDMTVYMPKSNSHVWDFVSNNMVFAGFNLGSAVFSDAAARRAVSMLLDRDNIVNSVYYTRAAASDYAINPSSWAAFDTNKKHHASPEGAVDELIDNGWSTAQNGSYFRPGTKNVYFSVKILVNGDSPERVRIAEDLAAAMNAEGLRASIVKCGSQEFAARISARNYDMFIGETELLPNGDLTPLAVTGQNCFGYSSPDVDALMAQLSILTKEADIKNAERVLCERLNTDMPFAPICFMKKSLITSAKLKSGVDPSVGGYVRNTENWGLQ